MDVQLTDEEEKGVFEVLIDQDPVNCMILNEKLNMIGIGTTKGFKIFKIDKQNQQNHIIRNLNFGVNCLSFYYDPFTVALVPKENINQGNFLNSKVYFYDEQNQKFLHQIEESNQKFQQALDFQEYVKDIQWFNNLMFVIQEKRIVIFDLIKKQKIQIISDFYYSNRLLSFQLNNNTTNLNYGYLDPAHKESLKHINDHLKIIKQIEYSAQNISLNINGELIADKKNNGQISGGNLIKKEEISNFCLSYDGQLVAICEFTCVNIKIFDISSDSLKYKLYRGSSAKLIPIMKFSDDSKVLVIVSLDPNIINQEQEVTIHIFNLSNQNSKDTLYSQFKYSFQFYTDLVKDCIQDYQNWFIISIKNIESETYNLKCYSIEDRYYVIKFELGKQQEKKEYISQNAYVWQPQNN